MNFFTFFGGIIALAFLIVGIWAGVYFFVGIVGHPLVLIPTFAAAGSFVGVFRARHFFKGTQQETKSVARHYELLIAIAFMATAVFGWTYIRGPVGEGFEERFRINGLQLSQREENLLVSYWGVPDGSKYPIVENKWAAFKWGIEKRNTCLHWRGDTENLVHKPSSEGRFYLMKTKNGNEEIEVSVVRRGEAKYGRTCN